MAESKWTKRRGKEIAGNRLGSLRIEHYANGAFIEATGLPQIKLTVAVARKLIAELKPYTEWLPPGTDRRTGRAVSR